MRSASLASVLGWGCSTVQVCWVDGGVAAGVAVCAEVLVKHETTKQRTAGTESLRGDMRTIVYRCL